MSFDRNKDFINKLYLNPLSNITSNFTKPKSFHPKKESQAQQDMQTLGIKTLPNLRATGIMGNVIMQNWETSKNIPPDIGDLIHYPVIMDKEKFNQNQKEKMLRTLPSLKKTDFNKDKIRQDGENLLKTVYGSNKNFGDTRGSPPKKLNHYSTVMNFNQLAPLDEEKFNEEEVTITEEGNNGPNNNQYGEELSRRSKTQTDLDLLEEKGADYNQDKNIFTKDNFYNTTTANREFGPGFTRGEDMYKKFCMTTTGGSPFGKSKSTPSQEEGDGLGFSKKSKLIDFSTFNKHLYLRDNDFLYAKRVGGPVDFALCTYKDINSKATMNATQVRFVGGKKILPSLQKKKKKVEYITISKNTVLHYQKGVPTVYSIQEWIENYQKYKELMKIPLFKNFKNAKLFDLWQRFYRKTKKQYYTEKLKKRLFLLDPNLLNGIINARGVLKEMKMTNIFVFENHNHNGSMLLNQFNERHKDNLVYTEKKIEHFRIMVKNIISVACAKSYQEYKAVKKITLDDNIIVNSDNDKNKNNIINRNNSKEKNTNNTVGGTLNNKTGLLKKEDDGSAIQNFIKDSIPYAQDATRKTHFKKLLRYIRVMDYIFNDAKYHLIEFSLEQLEKRFNRLYDCFINGWVDSPIIIVKILTMRSNIFYNPPMDAISKSVFEQFIQVTIYCVIYKKNFIDPQEFPKYMSCFEEVFEISVDQNTNLNNRLKEVPSVVGKLSNIKMLFDRCHEGLEKKVDELKPILANYEKNESIDFVKLEQTATPDQLKELYDEFHKQDEIINKLKLIVNIGIFEFQLEDLMDKVVGAPKRWLEKLKKVIPAVLMNKVKSSITRMTGHLEKLSVNPNDVESFIKLKKAVEACNKEKQLHEDMNNDIIDLQNIIESAKEIKLQELDNKNIIELKNVSVQYDRKLDNTSYFIDNNIQNFRLDLKTEITKFDNHIKELIVELNNESLNTYNEDTFNAIGFLEENSIKIKKCLNLKERYQQQEDDLEIDPKSKSNFENLENLVYEQDLKEKLWKYVKKFQDRSNEWDKQQVLSVDLAKMKKKIKKWLDLCKVAIVDIDMPHVPIELKKRIESYEQLVPILEAIQNPNITGESNLNSILVNDILKIDYKLDDKYLTCEKIKSMPEVFDRLPK